VGKNLISFPYSRRLGFPGSGLISTPSFRLPSGIIMRRVGAV
jgi:hypothetical protein